MVGYSVRRGLVLLFLVSTLLSVAGAQAVPAISSFKINNGATATVNPTVTLPNVCSGTTGTTLSHYLASELPDFTSATWKSYASVPMFTLSSGSGVKTVYFKVRDSVGAESAAMSDTITLKSPGSVVAWGSNYNWNGTVFTGQCNIPSPNSDFVSVAAGWGHSAGLKADGSIVAWGYNEFGQCNVPSPNRDFVAVAAADYHCLGLKSDGSIVAWGLDRKTGGQSIAPSPNSGFVAIAAGKSHNLGLKFDGSIVAWGKNSDDQGSYTGQCDVPMPNIGFAAISAGYNHSSAFRADGSIAVWGRDKDYFNPQYIGICTVPVPNSGFMALSAGYFHNLGLKSDGSIVAWGSSADWAGNYVGQCDIPSPNADFVSLSAGSYHNLGLKSDGSIVAWGKNNNGECTVPSPNSGFTAIAGGGNHSLAIVSETPPSVPVVSSFSINNGAATTVNPTVTLPNVCTVATGATHFYMASESANFTSSTWKSYASVPMFTLSSGSGVKTVYFKVKDSVGVESSVMSDTITLRSPGSVVAWGSNYNWNGTVFTGQCNIPSPNTDFVSVAAGWGHSAGLKANGSIVAWGNNELGQCNVPSPNRDFVAVAAVDYQTIGLKSDGSLVIWGHTTYGGQSSVPAPNRDFVAVSASRAHCLALKSDGSVVAWGANGSGQCNVPSPNRGFVAVSAGFFHSLALKADGLVLAWGSDVDYYNHQYTGLCAVPAPNTGFSAISAGWVHNLGLKSDGSIVTWGSSHDWLGQEIGSCTVSSPNTGFMSLSAGAYHSLGLKFDGSIVAWGKNNNGECTAPSPNSGFTAIAGGGNHSLAIVSETPPSVPVVSSFSINNGAATTVNPTVTLPNVCTGATGASHFYMASESPDFTSATWKSYASIPMFTLSSGSGVKTVYFKVKDSVGVESAVMSDTIRVESPGSVVAWGENNDHGQCSVPADNSGFVEISAGWVHSVGLKLDGSIVAWGLNALGLSTVPVPNSGFVSVSAGAYHTLGLKSDGSIVAWGNNDHGECTIPTPNSGFVAIAAGVHHSLGLKSDGSIVAWGLNDHGQGIAPVSDSGFVAIAAGVHHSLGLKSDGSIIGWGSNLDYKGNPVGQCNAPSPNSGFVSIAAGQFHSLGLKSDGSVVAWGSDTDWLGNHAGQCEVPAPDSGFVALARGSYHSLGVKSDGSAVAWGWNLDYRQVHAGQCDVPASNGRYIAVAGGGYHSLGLVAFSQPMIPVVSSFSINNGAATTVNPTVTLPNICTGATGASHFYMASESANFMSSTWKSYASIPMFTLSSGSGVKTVYFKVKDSVGVESAVMSDSITLCGSGFPIVAWGSNSHDQSIVPSPNSDFMALTGGHLHSLGLKSNGSVVAWGGYCEVPSPNSGLVAIAGGHSHYLGLKSDGSIVTWGYNESGQCSVPAPNQNFVAVAGGYRHSMGLKSDGSVVVWGDNSYGQRTVPTPNSGFVAVSAGDYHCLGLKSDGSIVAWGRNVEGQCTVPTPNSGFKAVSAGWVHSLGLKSDGSIVAWGSNVVGQCAIPTPNSGFSAISAGYYHNLALKSDGSVVTWGRNLSGECTVPVPNRGFVAIAGAGTHSLALRESLWMVTVGASPTDGGTVSKLPDQASYAVGSQVTLQATPAPGWSFRGWLDGATTVSTSPSYVHTVANADKVFTARFAAAPEDLYTLAVVANPANGGTVAKTPDLPAYAPGTSVTLQATPAAGWAFAGWRDGGVTISTNQVYVYTVGGSDKTFTANFSNSSLPEEFTVNLPGNVPLTLVRIPAGSFQMGSPDSERSHRSDEGPVHTVHIDYSFYMGKYEVTQGQWQAIMGDNPAVGYGTVGDNYPINMVELNQVNDSESGFIKNLNNYLLETGQILTPMRLPSEAEWEYACRGGSQTRFFFGDSLVDASGNPIDDLNQDGPAGVLPGNRSDYMWWQGNSGGEVHPVGTKLPNQFGLYDMHGNVCEWVQDTWSNDYRGAPTDGSPWINWNSTYPWLLRGGSWEDRANYCRSAMRFGWATDMGASFYGFRLSMRQENSIPCQYALTVAVSGQGAVTKSPDLATYVEGTTVTLTATPANGHHFAGWSGATTSTLNPLIVVMDTSKTVTAMFAINEYTLETGAVNGSVLKSPDLPVYVSGTTVTLTAQPDPFCWFDGWVGDVPAGMEQANPLVFTMNGNKTIEARFVLDTTPPTGEIVPDKAITAEPEAAFQVTFSEPVWGLEENPLVTIDLDEGMQYTSVTVERETDSQYRLQVSGVTGDGLLTLSVNPSACHDVVGNRNALIGPATVLFDTTPPNTVAAPVSDEAVSADTTVHFSWPAVTDPEPASGIAGYQCQIGTAPGAADLLDENMGLVAEKALVCPVGTTVYCRVRAFDQVGNVGAWSESSVGVHVNTPPVIASLGITPTEPRKPDVVTPALQVTDAEGDAIVDYRYEWILSDVVLSTDTQLTSDLTAKNQAWVLHAWAQDAVGTWSAKASIPFTIFNSPPTQPIVQVIPQPASPNQDLIVDVLVYSTDPDGDTIKYDFRWYKSLDCGKTWIHKVELDGSPQVSQNFINKGELWDVFYTPYEVEATSALKSLPEEYTAASRPAGFAVARAGAFVVGKAMTAWDRSYVGENAPPEFQFDAIRTQWTTEGLQLSVDWTAVDGDGEEMQVDLSWTDLEYSGLVAVGSDLPGDQGNCSALVHPTPGKSFYLHAAVSDSKGAVTQVITHPINLSGLQVTNQPASEVKEEAAVLNGFLSPTGDQEPEVLVYWGQEDGGLKPSAWEHVEALGSRGEGAFSVQVTGLLPGTRYMYRSVAKSDLGEAWAEDAEFFDTAVALPTSVTAVGNTYQVLVKWDAVTSATAYVIERTLAGKADATPVAWTVGAVTEFADDSAVPGMTYAYTVKSVDAWGNMSAPSEAVLASVTIEVIAPANYMITAKGYTMTRDLPTTGSLTFAATDGSKSGTIKIAQLKKLPANALDNPDKGIYYLKNCTQVPTLTIEGSVKTLAFDVPVYSLEASGQVRSVSARSVTFLKAGEFEKITITAEKSSDQGYYARTFIETDGTSRVPMLIKATGAVVEEIGSTGKTAQPIKLLNVASKVYKDGAQKKTSLGAVGSLPKVVADAAGVAVPQSEATPSSIQGSELKSVTVSGGSIVADEMVGDIEKVTAAGGNIRCGLIQSGTNLTLFQATAKKVGGVSVGGAVGTAGKPTAMVLKAQPQAKGKNKAALTKVYGQTGVSGYFYAGYDEATGAPNYSGGIGILQTRTPGVVEGVAFLDPEQVTKMKVLPTTPVQPILINPDL